MFQNNQLSALLFGWIVVLGLLIGTSFILALLLRFTSFSEPTLSWLTLVVGIISLFIGGIVAGVKGKQKGWMIGLMVGLGFTLLVFIIQYAGYDQAFSVKQTMYHLGYILAALIGGVIGVNVISSEEN